MAPKWRHGAVSTSLAGKVRLDHPRTLPAPLIICNLHIEACYLVLRGGTIARCATPHPSKIKGVLGKSKSRRGEK